MQYSIIQFASKYMILSKGVNHSNLFPLLIVLTFASALWVPHATQFLLAVISIMFVLKSIGRVRNQLEFHFLIIFLISCLGTLILALVHFELTSENLNQYGKTLGKVFFPAVFIFIVDAVYYQFRLLKIDVVSFSKFFIWVLIASTLLNIAFVFVDTQPNSITEIILGKGRVTFLASGLNPNHADDLYLIHIAALSYFNLVLISKKRCDWGCHIASILLLSYFVFSFYLTGSRGGAVGLLGGIVFTIIAYVPRRWRIWVCVVGGLNFVLLLAVVLMPNFFNRGLSAIDEVATYIERKEEFTSNINGTAKTLPSLLNVTKPSTTIDKADIRKECYPILQAHHEKAFSNTSFATNLRFPLWIDGYKIWLERPYLGHGEYSDSKFVASYDFVSWCHVMSFSHVHNFYLDLMVRGGLISIFIYFIFFVYLLFIIFINSISKEDKILFFIPSTYILYAIISNIFDMTFIRNTDLVSYALMLAALVGFHLSVSSIQSREPNLP